MQTKVVVCNSCEMRVKKCFDEICLNKLKFPKNIWICLAVVTDKKHAECAVITQLMKIVCNVSKAHEECASFNHQACNLHNGKVR